MAETRMEFWHRRGRELHGMRKAELIALYRQLGGLGGTYPPEKWTKDEVLNSVADIEWRRLPDDAKKAAPEHTSPPYEHHQTWSLGHEYQAPAEVQSTEHPASPAGATVEPYDYTGGMKHPVTEGARVLMAGLPSEAELADRIFGPGTAESLGTAAHYIERPSGPPVRVDGPGCTPAVVSVPCLGEECTGCSDPQCWTARADGGDA